jgi:hypothetical protein
MTAISFQEARFGGDRELLEQLRADEGLAQALQRTDILRRQNMLRARLLSQAVRVNVRLLPNVAESFAHLSLHMAGGKPLEAYVFAEPGINAFVAEGHHHTLVGVSSGAVSILSSEELKFVIGHELGHAAYGHLEVAPELLLETSNLDIRLCQQLRAWQRAAEVSADRAGLVCCGSLDVAASALFKTVSGLNPPGLRVEPAEFAEQWEHLVNEVLEEGRRDHWQLSHPFPPLRMKALMSFSQWGPGSAADAEAQRLLALMEGTSARKKDADDPFVSRFVFWGGAYVALAEGPLTSEARMRLGQVAPEGMGLDALMQPTGSASQLALQRFQEARRTRRAKLSPGELHRIATGLIDMVRREGPALVSNDQVVRLRQLGEELGLSAQAMDLMLSKRLKEG